jgi:hypothetical protein
MAVFFIEEDRIFGAEMENVDIRQVRKEMVQ